MLNTSSPRSRVIKPMFFWPRCIPRASGSLIARLLLMLGSSSTSSCRILIWRLAYHVTVSRTPSRTHSSLNLWLVLIDARIVIWYITGASSGRRGYIFQVRVDGLLELFLLFLAVAIRDEPVQLCVRLSLQIQQILRLDQLSLYRWLAIFIKR